MFLRFYRCMFMVHTFLSQFIVVWRALSVVLYGSFGNENRCSGMLFLFGLLFVVGFCVWCLVMDCVSACSRLNGMNMDEHGDRIGKIIYN